ncbi:hypothetical protein Sjap_011764 [Stephania japonica]|uniref:Uncharacterized protein n=1 Tax=Stephania japonica TaxID=461633 RepID=A0AAP0JBR9_9MAGN
MVESPEEALDVVPLAVDCEFMNTCGVVLTRRALTPAERDRRRIHTAVDYTKQDRRIVMRNDLTHRILRLDEAEGQSRWGNEMVEERKGLKHVLEHVLLMEGRVAHQKLKAKWAKKGDANTKLFQRMLSMRKGRNIIDRIQADTGKLTEDPREVENVILVYFKNIYSSSK